MSDEPPERTRNDKFQQAALPCRCNSLSVDNCAQGINSLHSPASPQKRTNYHSPTSCS